MPSAPIILLADDDDGHVFLVEQNLKRAGLSNRVERFSDGVEETIRRLGLFITLLLVPPLNGRH